MLRQRSRPYLFSNSLAPAIVGASITVMDMLKESSELRDRLDANTKYFRAKMSEAGFDIKPGDHPIVPVMFYDAVLAQNFAAETGGRGNLCHRVSFIQSFRKDQAPHPCPAFRMPTNRKTSTTASRALFGLRWRLTLYPKPIWP